MVFQDIQEWVYPTEGLHGWVLGVPHRGLTQVLVFAVSRGNAKAQPTNLTVAEVPSSRCEDSNKWKTEVTHVWLLTARWHSICLAAHILTLSTVSSTGLKIKAANPLTLFWQGSKSSSEMKPSYLRDPRSCYYGQVEWSSRKCGTSGSRQQGFPDQAWAGLGWFPGVRILWPCYWCLLPYLEVQNNENLPLHLDK